MKPRHLWVGACVAATLGTALAAAPRAKSLARFDVGFTQCEKKYPEMRGQGDQAYASVYRLKLDDSLRASLIETRQTELYKSERRRASQNLTKKAAAASDVNERLELQCQGLQREIQKTAGAAKR